MSMGNECNYINMLGAHCNRELRIGNLEPETRPLFHIGRHMFRVSKTSKAKTRNQCQVPF